MATIQYRGECVFCGNPVRGMAARELSRAWLIERAQGGGNQVSDPKEFSGRVAHEVCLDEHKSRLRSGIAEGQESLLA